MYTDMVLSLIVAAPLVKIKQAIAKLKQESTQMDIRIGVVQHVLLNAKLREKTSHSQNMNADDDEEAFQYWQQHRDR